MSATVTPIRKPMTPLERVKAQPTQTGMLLAANIEINALTMLVEELAGVVAASAKVTLDEELRFHLTNIAQRAREMIS